VSALTIESAARFPPNGASISTLRLYATLRLHA